MVSDVIIRKWGSPQPRSQNNQYSRKRDWLIQGKGNVALIGEYLPVLAISHNYKLKRNTVVPNHMIPGIPYIRLRSLYKDSTHQYRQIPSVPTLAGVYIGAMESRSVMGNSMPLLFSSIYTLHTSFSSGAPLNASAHVCNKAASLVFLKKNQYLVCSDNSKLFFVDKGYPHCKIHVPQRIDIVLLTHTNRQLDRQVVLSRAQNVAGRGILGP